MQRIVLTALLASVLGTFPVSAQPVPLNPYYYAAPQSPVAAQPPQYAQPGAPPRYTQPVPPPYYPPATVAQPVEAPRPNLGGGFIEFIFSGGQTQHGRPVYRPQPAPQPVAPVPATMQAMYPPYAPASAPVIRASLPPAQRAIDPRFFKQTVAYHGDEEPGTIIINTPERMLYLVQEDGTALRYGIGVGRPGFTWAGMHHVTEKREWPDWRPPKEMLLRRPDLPRYMAGGPDNPLGARALYLGSTLYRIHGSNEPWTIGQQVSSGCIRMRNEDVIDLYERVNLGAKVVVI